MAIPAFAQSVPQGTELSRRPASWKPFGLAFLAATGLALAQGVDHSPFDALLKANVRNGVVNYAAFERNPEFRAYLASLEKPARLDSASERLAYSINAYNALAIEGILEGLSPSSLVGRARYFKLKEWPLDGRKISLYDLEHQVIRPQGEPRIHFAIVCASLSCPVLRSEAYVAARLDAQLDDQARRFVNDATRNRFDKATRTAYLSEIFKWFEDDFKTSAGSVQKFAARYANDPAVARELEHDGYRIEWIDYDWRLNGTPPRS